MAPTSSTVFQAVIQLLQCNRRVPKSTALARAESNGKLSYETAKLRQHSESSDVSTTDEASDHYGTLQSEDSEQTDCPITCMRAPPGLAPPPGLGFKPYGDQSHESANSCSKYWDSVISRQPKRTLHKRTDGPAAADAPWSVEQGTSRPPAFDQSSRHRRHQKQAPNATFIALKEALDKLAPTEIAAVRSLLDSKSCSAGAGESSRTWNNAVGSGRPHRPPTSSAVANALNRKPDMNDVDTGESLQTFLQELALIDDARVVSVRKINALGFGAAPLLKEYFSKFGTVDRVMVAPSVVKSKMSLGKSRARPAGLGFVVMQTSEDVQAILKHGETHSLAGGDIRASPFQSHSIDGTD